MEVTKQEAQGALDEISRVSEKTRQALAQGPSPQILMLWGLVWVVGNVATQFAPMKGGLVWMVAGSLGAVGTYVMKSRYASRVTHTDGTSDPNMRKIGWAWGILFAYGVLWVIILNPAGGDRSGATISRQVSAFFSTIPMFAYVLGGIWFGRFYVILGLAVTAGTVIGLFFFPAFFWIWMAVFGGGALLLSGLYMKQTWGLV